MQNKLFTVTYGSHLYGTNTATSDTDLKTVYLPSLRDLVLLKKPKIFKVRQDADGVVITDDLLSMPDNGTETEHFPLQTFVRDYVAGQTYAVEMAFAILGEGTSPYRDFIQELVDKFSNSQVSSMVGFALKQTFDYVHRGDRLNSAKAVENVLMELIQGANLPDRTKLRLDDAVKPGENVKYLDVIAQKTGLKIGESAGGNKTLRTLEMNGRCYLETSAVVHVLVAVQKLIKQYGTRSTAAADTEVDFKSLSHAVRVYQQAIEYLDTGKITFPRANAEFLLSVKQGKSDLEATTQLLRDLDKEAQEKMANSKMRPFTPELVEEAEEWLLEKLSEFYGL